jgi:hypothetical protein
MSINEVETSTVLSVSIVVIERRENFYGMGIELAQQNHPVKHLSLCSQAVSKAAAVYSAFTKIAKHIPDDVKLLLIRCNQGVHISRHAIKRRLQDLENAPQIYVSNASLQDHRYRTLLDLGKYAVEEGQEDTCDL